MREFFDNIPLDNQEISEEQIQKIKASVLSRVKEEKAMSKRTTIKTITLAVAAATTAALSAMIASAEQSAWTPATDVEYTVYDAAETEVSEVTADNGIDEAKTDETIDGRTVSDTEDLATIIQVVQRFDDSDVGYIYYYKMSDKEVEKLLSSGWTLVKVSTDE